MAPRIPWLQNHALAESETRTGWSFEAAVAAALRAAGIAVTEPPKSWRASVSERKSYKNEIDIIAAGRRLSVKSRRIDFTDVSDVPRANDPLFIDVTRKWDGFVPQPWAVVCVSQTTHAMIWLPASTQPQWSTKKTYDRVRGIPTELYTAPVALWQPFATLPDALRVIDDGVWRLEVEGTTAAAVEVTVEQGRVIDGAARQTFIELVRNLRQLGTLRSTRLHVAAPEE